MSAVITGLGALMISTALAGCTGAAVTPSTEPSRSGQCTEKEAFDITLPSPGAQPIGAATPYDAIRTTGLVLPPEYGSPDTVWATASSRPGPVRFVSPQGATVLVTALPDGRWTVLSGERCR